MGGFSADWLALREPSDARARSAALTAAVLDRLAGVTELRILDLAAGTGANVRYLAGCLTGDRRSRYWLLADNDAALLARAPMHIGPYDRVETRLVDLAGAFDPAADNLCDGRDLVTASALLDLVSERWLQALARRCRDARAAVLFALTYDGGVRCSPEESDDETVRELVNRHQRIDKGFGPALGPEASELASSAFAALGYEVQRARSDWRLAADVPELQSRLIDGWAEAAETIAPERAARFRDWRARRLAHVAAGQSRLTVGHEELAAWLA
jgi:hypothetical protein